MKINVKANAEHKLIVPVGKFSDGWFRCTYCGYKTFLKVPEGRVPLCPECEHRMEKI